MKNFLLFLLILTNNGIYACIYYPYGEDARISLFDPHITGYLAYSDFYYSSIGFRAAHSAETSFSPGSVEPNVKLWFDYCKGKADMASIHAAVYKLSEGEIHDQSKNKMIQYLYQEKDNDALHYLRFAKNCEYFNSWQGDPWEKQADSVASKRTELMNKAISFAGKVKNKELKKRYTFLAIRLAYYSRQFNKVELFFASVFENAANKDILYYWSLFFKSTTEKNPALTNFELAQVFANAADKRFVCHQNFEKKIPIDHILRFAKTNVERANVYLLAGVERYDKALECLEKMYEYNPSSDGLSFLLLREINKIEDFVFTPYYTLFQPSISYNFWSGSNDVISLQKTLMRAERDREYAREVLQFVNRADLQKVENPFFWKTCKAYLKFITGDHNACLSLVNVLEKSAPDPALANQLQIIKALALTANQRFGKAVIPEQIKATLLANQKNGQFIFAVGKELEYLGNSTDAALLYSRLAEIWGEPSLEDGSRGVYWKSLNNKKKTLSLYDYFADYFEYADVVYNPEQIKNLIYNVERNKDGKDSFTVFLYEKVKLQNPQLYDLLGTKFIRQNKLENALIAFEKAGARYWARAYTSWEDDDRIFDKNPFYCLKYTPQFITPVDTIRLNKYTVTKQLIHYLSKAKNEGEKDRDYYYFLVANAYFNMGVEGNVWMMRRLGRWSSYSLSGIEDEMEFRQSNLASHYYSLARQYAQTEKFRALCLRMMIRCERHVLVYKDLQDRNHDFEGDSLFATNKYYWELNKNYPEYFDDLVSNCDKFEDFFNARR